MTCAQGLLRLLWGGPEVGVLRDWPQSHGLLRLSVSNPAELKFVYPRCEVRLYLELTTIFLRNRLTFCAEAMA